MKMKEIIFKSTFLSILLILFIISPLFCFGSWEITFKKGITSGYNFDQDTSAPSLDITQPENLSSITGWFFISVTAIDDVSVDQVVYREISSPIYIQMSQNETDPTKYRVLVDSRQFSNGVNIFEIKANDTSNNENTTILLIAIQNLEAEADIYIYNVTGLTEDCPCLTDDNTSAFWLNVPAHPIPEFGGYVKFSHNFSYVFGLFVYDSSLMWISLQFDNDGDGICMENGEDIWWFQEGETNADYTAANFRTPILDTDQDIDLEFGTTQTNDSSMKFFEIVRLVETNEATDVKFQFGIPIAVIFASSGLHQGGNRANFSLALRSGSPTDITDTSPLTNTGLSDYNRMDNFIIFGGFGLILNIVVIVGLLIFDKRR